MATVDLNADDSNSSSSLRSSLTAILPLHHRFFIHHLSTPPSRTEALYPPPPNRRPDVTYCEKHFFSLSIQAPPAHPDDVYAKKPREGAHPALILALGLEVYIYTTAFATTLFISKADSSGFLGLLNLPKETPSPIREVCSAFIAHLVQHRSRSSIQLTVTLFARAQDQYLFPGSVEHGGKHVLNDGALVKWWCRVVDTLISNPPTGTAGPWEDVKGYLVIPGLDAHETRAFTPRLSSIATSWSFTHPLEFVSHYYRELHRIPPRCIVPRFPDDPMARFCDELDDEAARSGDMQTTGNWKTVQTIDVFWEMMAYRQECSSGRMTGFIWAVFNPVPAQGPDLSVSNPDANPCPTSDKPNLGPAMARGRTNKAWKKKVLTGPIKNLPSRKLRQRNHILNRQILSPYYYWPIQGRGERIVDDEEYKRTMELLLQLDFSSLDGATRSTERWITEAGLGMQWGVELAGTRDILSLGPKDGTDQVGATEVNTLSGLVKRRRVGVPDVNVLSAGLIRKKPKP